MVRMYLCCWEDADKTAEALGIHRSTVYRWIRRAHTVLGRKLRHTGLIRQSTKPHMITYALSPQAESAIILLRETKGWAAEKIKHKLKVLAGINTIHRLIVKRGLVNAYGNHRRPHYQETTHMHAKNTNALGYLQMDVKYITPSLSGLTWTCFEYGIIDIFSRYKEAIILNHLDEDGSISALSTILPKLPFKSCFIQTDNGLEFQRRFHSFAESLTLRHHYVHKSTPNENALIERSFRTDEEEFFFRLEKAPSHYDELRDWFSTYLLEYNTERPHFGIDLKTPLEVIRLSQMS